MMKLDFYVEEPSAEAALKQLVPAILGKQAEQFEINIFAFNGKQALLKKLPNRLKSYQTWFKADKALSLKIIVLLDRDNDDCSELKEKLNKLAEDAGLVTRTVHAEQYHVINRIVIEEIEAWFFGDVAAICQAYPSVPASLANRAKYRDPDAIRGGSWEQLEVVLRKEHPGGLEKIRAAKEISQHMNPDNNRSKSFQLFRDTLRSIRP